MDAKEFYQLRNLFTEVEEAERRLWGEYYLSPSSTLREIWESLAPYFSEKVRKVMLIKYPFLDP